MKEDVGILEEVDLVVTAKVGRARECQLGPAQLEATSGSRTIDALGSAGGRVRLLGRKGRTEEDEPGRAIRAGDQRRPGVVFPAGVPALVGHLHAAVVDLDTVDPTRPRSGFGTYWVHKTFANIQRLPTLDLAK
ncbi:MAG TPA: hypothetical protein VK390_10360 [Propionibacteriaceae bacterium]|nr:hypothetical protein [Propionibacteriaceae bacterium]